MKSSMNATPRSAAPLVMFLARLPLAARYLGMSQQERETLATRKLQRFLRGWTDQSRVVVHLHTSSLCVNLLRFVSDAGRCSN